MSVHNDKIRELMRERKITQEDLAGILGMTQPAVAKRLNSEKTFEVDDLIKICRHLGMSVGEFLDESPIEEKKPPQLLSPDDMLMLLNLRHNEVMNVLKDIKQLLGDGLKGKN